MNNRITAILLSILLVSFSTVKAQDQNTESTEFWLTYLENLDLLFNGDPQFSLYIDAEASGELLVEFPATGLSYEYEYDAGTITEVILPAGLYYSESSEVATNKGLRITTSTPIELTAFHYRIYFSEATKVLPIESLGSEYYVISFLDFDQNVDSPSSFVVLATEDDTEIEITPTANTTEFRPKDVPFIVDLNAGQTFEVQSQGELTGSSIIALNGEKIAVFNGALKGNVACGPADSHMYDQQLPRELHGNDYAAIPFGNQSKGYFRILSLEDNNQISISGSNVETLEKGEHLDIELNEPSIISSSEDCSVAQFSYSFECSNPKNGDPNMLQLYPLEFSNKRCRAINSIGFGGNSAGFTSRYITLITEAASESSVEVDELPIQWNSINSTDYKYSIVEVQEESSSITAPLGVQAYAYGFGEYDAYTYGLGYDRNITSETSEIVDESFELFPNPTSNFVRLNSETLIVKLSIYNQIGQELDCISDLPSKSLKIDLSQFPSGMLYFQIQTNNGITRKSVHKI